MGDAARNVSGRIRANNSDTWSQFLSDTSVTCTGSLFITDNHTTYGMKESDRTNTYPLGFGFDSSRAVPVGAANVPRSWGSLACAYLGQRSA